MESELHYTRQSLRLLWALCLWLIFELTMIALGVPDELPRPMIGMLIVGPALAMIALWRRSVAWRAWASAVNMRVLALPHLLRIAFGSAFLYQVEQGALPFLFGRPAGTGDVIAGVGALLLLLTGITHRRAWRVWNILGLCDMIMVITLAQYHIFGGHFDSMRLMFTFPYALAPFIAVPTILTTHVIMLHRLITTSGTSSAAS